MPFAKGHDTAIGVKWSPYIPHDPTKNVKQLAMLVCQSHEVLYGGAAGGGKSDALLMAALQYVDVPGYAALLLRRTYPELAKADGLIPRAASWLKPTDASWNEQKHMWTFPSGATLEFGHIQRAPDVYNYHSAAYQYIGFDELTTFEKGMYTYMFSRLRRLKGSDVPIRMRAGSNPGGVGHDWVQERFITNPGPDRVFIPATLDDNPFLDKDEYEKSLAELDPVTRAQLRQGDWTARREGAAFKREWFTIVGEAPGGVIRVRYLDLAATADAKGKDPDYTVGVLLSFRVGVWYVEDVRRIRATPATVESLVKQTAALDGKSTAIFMEQEPGASGVNTIDHYARRVLPGYVFKGIKSSVDKLERARPFISASENGNVRLVSGPWNGAYLDELEGIPFGPHDDQMDATSGAMSQLRPQIGYDEFARQGREAGEQVSESERAARERLERASSGSPLAEVY